jgi:DNA-binding response OmpR family regulator
VGTGKVLVVDDDPSLATQVRDLLRFDGYQVTIARDGKEGLRKLKDYDPDLVLLDMNMPELSGLGFLKRFGEMSFAVKPAILVFTARDNMGDFFDGVDVAGYMTKPCDADTILKTVNDVMARHAYSAAARVRAPQEKSRVLLAEDDMEAAQRIADAFGATGFLVERADTGPAALERAVAQKPDILVAKLILTGMNGYALASALSETPATENIPVVLNDDSGLDVPQRKYVTGKDGVKAFVRGNNARELAVAVKGVLA